MDLDMGGDICGTRHDMSLMEGSGKYRASTTKYSCQKKTYWDSNTTVRKRGEETQEQVHQQPMEPIKSRSGAFQKTSDLASLP